MNHPKIIATYCRVSTTRQEEDQTIRNQQIVLKEFAEKNNLVITKEYVDEGWSGDILARPALDKLRQERKSKLWSGVLMYDPDRLARRYSYQELVMDELREAGIEVFFVTVAAPKNSEDKILHGVRGLFAEYERTKIAERFRLGKMRRISEGNILVSEPLYGYNYILRNEKIPGHYIINEQEAAVVRNIFDWVGNEGLSLRKVIARLQDLEITPRKSKRGVWATSTLSKVLRNEAYIGKARWGSSYAVEPENPRKVGMYKRLKKSSRRTKHKEEWLYVPVPPIIDNELFKMVQIRLTENPRLARRNKINEYLLAGLIKCNCGRARGGEGPQKGKHLYYRCTDRIASFPLPPSCSEKVVNARKADIVVWEAIVKLMTCPITLRTVSDRYFRGKKGNKDSKEINIEIIKTQISKLEGEIDRYNKAYAGGLFDMLKLQEYTEPIKTKIIELRHQILESHQETDLRSLIAVSHEEIKLFTSRAADLIKGLNFDEKKAIVRCVVKSVVGNKYSLLLSGNIPIKNVEVFTNHRYGGNAIRHLSAQSELSVPFHIKLYLN